MGVAFSDDASSVVVASQTVAGGCSLYMYGEEKPKASEENKQQSKLPLPEIKWERHKVHDKRSILTLFGAAATYGSADGSTIIASCSEGIFRSIRPSPMYMSMPILYLLQPSVKYSKLIMLFLIL